MSVRVRNEEYAPLAEFLMTSFERDQPAIEGRFPKLNRDYLTLFRDKLARVNQLESTLMLTSEQSRVTADLYADADVLNKDMNFLSSYYKDAGLPTAAITELKKLLAAENIEGALLELKAVKQFTAANEAALEAEGMPRNYVAGLEASYTSISAKNAMQNSIMNQRKTLVDANKQDYSDLYAYISNVAEKGKLVFDGSRVEDEYTIAKIIGRMRAPKRKDDDEPEA